MYTRAAPLFSRIKERSLLTLDGSTRKTFHIVLDILDAHFHFKVGDSVAIAPMNAPEEVQSILSSLQMSGDEQIFNPRTQSDISFQEFLYFKANLSRGNTTLIRLLLDRGAPRALLAPLLEPENKGKLNEFLQSHTLAELLTLASLSPTEIVHHAMPLLPRFYSIANSTKMFPEEIHLTVANVEYMLDGKRRKGVGSHFLCELAEPGITPIPIYLQPSHHFTVPQDPQATMILVGPGTGVAPFRAFLQERLAMQAPGRNWLFFGERHRKTDFYYESFWKELESQGRLRLTTAFSRDAAEKTYVQHKMYEERNTLWQWIQEGAYFYVCGDASKMAKDVEETLLRIIREEGALPDEEARLYLKKMKTEKRYLADIY